MVLYNDRIRLEDFANAVRLKGIVKEKSEAYNIANTVMNFFGYEERIIDNSLGQEVRNLFYELEDNKILLSQKEDHVLPDRKNWIIFYWVFNKHEIFSTLEKDRLLKDNFLNEIDRMDEMELEEFKQVVKKIENGEATKEELGIEFCNIEQYLEILKETEIIDSTKDENMYHVTNKERLGVLY